MAHSIKTGDELAGRYLVIRKIARGTNGTIYEVQDREQTGGEDRYALKILHAERAKDEESEERFRREAMVLFDLKHPAIVQVFNFGVLADGAKYLTMDLIEGETLREHLDRTGPMAPAAVAPIAADLCSALDHAHQNGVIHRDLRPEHILLTPQGPARVKLLDIGVAKVLWDAPLTGSGVSMGSLGYLPPEQLRGARDVDPRADVYSLGVVLYEALAGPGNLPFAKGSDLAAAVLKGERSPLRTYRADLGEPLEAALAKAIAIDREERWATAGAFRKAFVAACG